MTQDDLKELASVLRLTAGKHDAFNERHIGNNLSAAADALDHLRSRNEELEALKDEVEFQRLQQKVESCIEHNDQQFIQHEHGESDEWNDGAGGDMNNIGRLRQLQSEVRRLDNMISKMIKKSFCDSENLEEPRDYAEDDLQQCIDRVSSMAQDKRDVMSITPSKDYPETVADIVRETRHGGNMIGGNRK